MLMVIEEADTEILKREAGAYGVLLTDQQAIDILAGQKELAAQIYVSGQLDERGRGALQHALVVSVLPTDCTQNLQLAGARVWCIELLPGSKHLFQQYCDRATRVYSGRYDGLFVAAAEQQGLALDESWRGGMK